LCGDVRKGVTEVAFVVEVMNFDMGFFVIFLFSLFASENIPRLRMPPDTLENGVGKEGDCGGIDDSELFYPPLAAVSSAVRRKSALVLLVQVFE